MLVSSRVGQVRVPCEVSDEIARGVVSLPHGFGHHRPGVRLGVAVQHAGVSANDVIDDGQLDALTGTACLSGGLVRVAKADDPPSSTP